MGQIKKLISSNALFQSMQPEHIAVLAEGARLVEFAAQELIFRETDVASHCHLIQKGRIALESHVPGGGSMKIQMLGEGEVFGWSWLFPPYLIQFQARALEPAQTIRLDGAHLLIACEKDRDFGYELIKRFSQVLIERLQATRQQFRELQRGRVAPA